MIVPLKPYPLMKETGLAWLGQIPKHWEVRRGKSFFHPVDVRSSTGEEELLTVSSERGIVKRASATVTMFKAESYVGYKLCWAGDLVINSLWAWAKGLGVSPYHGIISSAYGVYRLRSSFRNYSRYIHELVRSVPFQWELQVRSKGIWVSRLQLTDEAFLDAPFPLPTPFEQESIVRFLNYVDSRIRRYIRAKQKLIELLEEQKQAIIHRAVTRGLDPNVRLKPSGVEWLGDVPAHWEVKRLKWATRLQRGYDLPADRRIAGSYPVVSSGGIIDSHFESKARGPGVVLGRYGSTDSVFYIESDFWPHNTSLFVTHFYSNSPHWCYFLLRTISKADHAGKSAVPGVDRKDLFEIPVAIPPLAEQEEVAREITSAGCRIDASIRSVNRAIQLFHEYRKRLIADVVTGKLDVREAAERLPKEAEEPEPIDEIDGAMIADENPGEEIEERLEPIEA